MMVCSRSLTVAGEIEGHGTAELDNLIIFIQQCADTAADQQAQVPQLAVYFHFLTGDSTEFCSE